MTGSASTIGIITYDFPHLKTEQLLLRLRMQGALRADRQTNYVLLALPFNPRPQRQISFQHRPDQTASIPTRELAARFGLPFVDCTYEHIPDCADVYLVAGAGIFRPSAIGTKKLINAHPGIIPSVRGLDAFKWSILEQQPLGNTLHYIDEEVDAGEVIAILKTPVFQSDTIDTLARRHYEAELAMLADFRLYLDPDLQVAPAQFPASPAKMRMPASREAEMMAAFEPYKQRFSGVVASQDVYR